MVGLRVSRFLWFLNFEKVPRKFETFGEFENFRKDSRTFENVPRNFWKYLENKRTLSKMFQEILKMFQEFLKVFQEILKLFQEILKMFQEIL